MLFWHLTDIIVKTLNGVLSAAIKNLENSQSSASIKQSQRPHLLTISYGCTRIAWAFGNANPRMMGIPEPLIAG